MIVDKQGYVDAGSIYADEVKPELCDADATCAASEQTYALGWGEVDAPTAPVHGANGDGLGEASQEHGDASLVGTLAGGAQHAAHHDVTDGLRHAWALTSAKCCSAASFWPSSPTAPVSLDRINEHAIGKWQYDK